MVPFLGFFVVEEAGLTSWRAFSMTAWAVSTHLHILALDPRILGAPA